MSYTFIIRADQPYNGTTQSVMCPDGVHVAYTGGKTWEEYQTDTPFPVKMVSEDDLLAMDSAYQKTLYTKPSRITKQAFWDALEVLPPCRWHSVGNIEVFHISERIRGSLVAWYAHKGDRYYTWNHESSLTDDQIRELFA